MPATYEKTFIKCSLRMITLCNDANGDPVYEEDGETRATESTTFRYLDPQATDANIVAAYTALAGLQIHTAETPLVVSESSITVVDNGE